MGLSPPSAAEVIDAFRNAILDAGVPYSGEIIADGGKHRVAADDDKPGGRSIEYALHLDGRPAGFARDYRQHRPGEDVRWKWNGSDLPLLTAEQRRQHAAEIEQRKAQRAAEEAERHRRAAEAAAERWQAAGVADLHHGYLARKRIEPHGVRQDGPHLLLRAQDAEGVTWGLQTIDEAGTKRFQPGMRKAGTFAAVAGDWHTAERVFVGEGFATIATVAEALRDSDASYLAAWDKGNLEPVAAAIRTARPEVDLVILADNDAWKHPPLNPGVKYATRAAEATGGSVVIPKFAPRHHPPPGSTAGPTDWNDLALLEGADAVRQQITDQLVVAQEQDSAAADPAGVPASPSAPTTSPPSPDDLVGADPDAAVAELAKLSPLAFEQQAKETAKALGVPVTTLRKEVEKARKAQAGAAGPAEGSAIELYEPEPWPHPVHLADVLDEMHATVRRYVICSDSDAVKAVLWAAHTHVYDRRTHTPRLIVTAPAEECAKSLLLKVIQDMAPRPIWTENPSQATFYRMADAHRPTFFLSEVDMYGPPQREIVKDANGGWEAEGAALRCVGDSNEVRLFSTHIPVAFDGIGLLRSDVLPRTTVGRSHVIEMQRATPEEVASIHELDRAQHRDMARSIARKLARWAQDHGDTFSRHRPEFPEGIVNRRRDKWDAMLSTAELASPEWAEAGRAAMLADAGAAPGKLATELQLLLDVRDVIRPAELSIWTDELIDRICKSENSRWAEHNARLTRDPEKLRIRPDQLKELLAVYSIEPIQIKKSDVNKRGYRVEPILAAAARYAPADPAANDSAESETAEAAAQPHREII